MMAIFTVIVGNINFINIAPEENFMTSLKGFRNTVTRGPSVSSSPSLLCITFLDLACEPEQLFPVKSKLYKITSDVTGGNNDALDVQKLEVSVGKVYYANG